MNRHLKKLPKSFDRENPEADQARATGRSARIRLDRDPTDDPADETTREPGG